MPGVAARRPPSIGRLRRPSARRLCITVAAAALLAACDLGLATRGGLVVNLTERDLVVEVLGEPDREPVTVESRSSWRFDAYQGCLGTGVAVYTPDGARVATLDQRICDGERLTIDDEDWIPVVE